MSEEQNYQEAFDSMEPPVQPQDSQEPASLGRVKLGRSDEELEEVRMLNEKMGYIPFNIQNMPSQGRYYRNDMSISIRAARVAEIRDFSTMDENNLFDVDEKLNNILATCVRVDFGGRRGSYKDILEEDRLYVILSVRELTFKSGENKLIMKAKCKQCSHDNEYELRTNTLQYYDASELDKYYDNDMKAYVFATKTEGSVIMCPPTIGVMRVVTDFIKGKEEKKEKWDKSFLQVLPYLHREWRGFDDKAIFQMNVEFNGWSEKKFSIVYRLAEKIRIGVKQELNMLCANCDAEVTVPVTFPGGVKSLFVVSDIFEELL
jgi:hypothetical protein